MDWKKLVLAGVIALVSGLVMAGGVGLLLNRASITEWILYGGNGWPFLILQVTGGAILYWLLRQYVQFDFGNNTSSFVISSLKVWVVAVILLGGLYLAVSSVGEKIDSQYKACLEKKTEQDLCFSTPGRVCTLVGYLCFSPAQKLLILFLMSCTMPYFFLPGAYLARRFLKW